MQATWNKKDKLYEDEQKEETAPSICQQPTIRKNGMNWSHPINTRSAHHSLHSATRQLRGIGFITLFCRQHWGSVFYSFYGWSWWMWRTVQGQCLPVVHAQPPCQVLEAAGWREAMIAMPSMGRKSGGCLWWLRAIRLCFIHLYPSLSCILYFISPGLPCDFCWKRRGTKYTWDIRSHLFALEILGDPWSFFFLRYFWGKLWQMDFGLMNSSMFWRKSTYVYIYNRHGCSPSLALKAQSCYIKDSRTF